MPPRRRLGDDDLIARISPLIGYDANLRDFLSGVTWDARDEAVKQLAGTGNVDALLAAAIHTAVYSASDQQDARRRVAVALGMKEDESERERPEWMPDGDMLAALGKLPPVAAPRKPGSALKERVSVLIDYMIAGTAATDDCRACIGKTTGWCGDCAVRRDDSENLMIAFSQVRESATDEQVLGVWFLLIGEMAGVTPLIVVPSVALAQREAGR
jgi:hypothetical protein